MDLQRNPYQRQLSFPTVKRSTVKGLKKRIKKLEITLKELIGDMRDLDRIKKYQAIIDEGYQPVQNLQKTSEYIGVSKWNSGRGTDWYRMRFNKSDDEVIVEYYREEINAAKRYDDLLLEYSPENTDYLNFIPKGWEAEDCLRTPNVIEKRKFISKFGSPDITRMFCPRGLSYITSEIADKIVSRIESTTEHRLEDWWKAYNKRYKRK